jgi:RND family efflux transporter MFP subunit
MQAGNQQHQVRRKWLLAGAGAAALILLWSVIRIGGGGRIEPGLLEPRADRQPNLPLGEVLLQNVPIRYELIGTIQSRVPVMAASRVAARVIEVKVRAGDRVVRGQILVKLDASDLNAQIAQAQGELAAANAELVRATADEKRFSALYSRGSVTASEREGAQAAYRSATGKAAQARAALAAARAAFEYATVRAPADGTVVERMVEPGDLAMPGKPLVRLQDGDALRVELLVPEELARNIQPGSALHVRVAAIDAAYQTRVSEVVPAADPATRSFMVRAPLPNARYLQPGMFARATLAAGSQPALTLPRDAIRSIGQLQTARVVSDGMIQTRMVSLGRSFGDRIEVLAGVNPGDRVLLDGQETGGK